MSKQQPHFLVSVPTFNRSHLLPAVMESIQEQQYQHYDILFVDDCSEDDTKQVISEYQARFDNVHYARMPENSGVNAVRNKILDIARTDFPDSFIYFIDDDDLLYKDCLENAADLITGNPGYNWYSMDCVYPDGKPISILKRYGELSYLDDYMFGKNIRGDITNIIKANAVGDARFTDRFKNAEVWFFWCNLAKNNNLFASDKIGSIKEYLPGGITQNGLNRDRAIDVARLKIEALEPIVGRKKLRHQYVTLAKHLIAQGKGSEARSYLKPVFKCSPFYFRQYRHWIKSLIN